MKHIRITLSFGRLLTGMAVLGLFGAVIAHESGQRALAVTNYAPTGSFTTLSCSYDTSRKDYLFTITAKWNDPNAPSNDPANAYLGSKTSTGVYNGAGTPSAVNAIDGVSHNGPTYTWRLYRSTLTDAKWPIQLFVHDIYNPTSNTWKSVTHGNKPTCPTPPAPVTAPAPAPAPAPTGSTKTGSSSNRSGSSGSAGTSAPAASSGTPAPTADADADAATGTVSARLTMPAGNATVISILYSTPGGQQITSPNQAITDDPASIELDNLQPKTTYTYQIIRVNSAGASATSPTATFKTNGYTIGIKFTDAKGKGISGISGTIDENNGTQTKSNSDGWLNFKDQDDGTHTVSYTYQGKKYSESFDTSAATLPDDPTKVVSLTDTVDVSTLAGAPAQKSGGSSWVVIVLSILLLAVLGVGIWFFLRRRRLQREYAVLNAPIATGSNDIFDQTAIEHLPKHPQAQQPLPAHAGQSLRDMVVESIQQQGLPTTGSVPAVPGHPGVEPQAPAPYTPLPPQPTLPVAPTAQPLPPPIPPVEQPAPHPHAKPQAHHDGSDDTTLQISH